jgi:hypothetical protein
MRTTAIVFLLVVLASPAFAQTYVAGLFGVDAVRSTRTQTQPTGTQTPTADGEALTGAVRVGTSLGSRWGLELEVARTANIDRETTYRPPFAILTGGPFPLPGQVVPVIFPPVTLEYRYRLRERHTTVSPVAWISQTLGRSVELAYVGGFAFTRAASTLDLTIGRTSPIAPVLPPSVQTTRRTVYGAGPVAGVDARFAMTDHIRLITGIRMQGVKTSTGDGWAARAAAGLGWVF